MDACDSKPTRVNEHAIHAMCLQVIPRGEEGASMAEQRCTQGAADRALYIKLWSFFTVSLQ